jgi:hypothetical protein
MLATGSRRGPVEALGPRQSSIPGLSKGVPVLRLGALKNPDREKGWMHPELSMKATMIFPLTLFGLLIGAGQLPLAGQILVAQNSSPTINATETRATGVKTVRLSAGLDEIVKLTKAGVDESVILVFVEKSPVAYNPTADEIIRLRENGVSSAVVAALLKRGEEIRQRAAETAKQPASASQAPATVNPPAPTPATPTQTVTTSPTVVYTTPTYYASPAYGWGGYYSPGYFYPPAYSCYPGGYYYRGYYPRFSVGIGFGGYYGHGGFYGGYRGGYAGHYRGGYGYCR